MGTTKITYTSTEGDVRTTEHTSNADAWETLQAYGRMVPELGAEIEEAGRTGYALQPTTFAALRDGVSHTVTVEEEESWEDAIIPQSDRRTAHYQNRIPALTGAPVTQGDTDYCRDRGHAAHTVDGADTGTCPRCGNVTPEAYDASRAILRGTVVEYLHIGTRTWKRATVESFRARDAVYVLRTEHGTDAAPARHVHTLLPSDTAPATVEITDASDGAVKVPVRELRVTDQTFTTAGTPITLRSVTHHAHGVRAIREGGYSEWFPYTEYDGSPASITVLRADDAERGESSVAGAVATLVILGGLFVWIGPAWITALLGI